MIALAAAVLAAAAAATSPETGVAAPVVWTEMAAGAAQATLAAPDGTKIRLYRFAFPTFEAKVFVGAGKPPRPETAAALRRRLGAAAVVNGGFFNERRAPLGLRIAAGETRVPLRARVDWGVLVIEAARARIIHSRDWSPGETVLGAIQVGPRLVVDGQALKLKPALARRTAVALPRDGRALTLVIVDDPVDANDLAAALAAAGFDTALMLDGGPSTQLALHAGAVDVDIPGGYAVPDLLTIMPASAAKAKSPSPPKP